MAYSPEELEALKDKIRASLADGGLTDWQRQFLTDLDERIGKYGNNVRFSDKQISKLYEILSSRSQRAAQQVRQRPPRPVIASYAPRRQRSMGRAVAREGRWFARRMMRDVTVLVVLIAGFFIYAGYQKLDLPGLGSLFSSASPAYASRSISTGQFTITEGDTIRLNGEPRGTRLVGFNAPETIEPQCSEEEALGLRAKARLRQLLSASAALELQRVPCSCAPNTEGTDQCNHGRSCASLKVDGTDVGQLLIAEGLAAPFACGKRSCPPTPRPWCS